VVVRVQTSALFPFSRHINPLSHPLSPPSEPLCSSPGQCMKGTCRHHRLMPLPLVHHRSIVQGVSGQEKLFGKTPKRGPSGPLWRTVRDTRVTLGQEHCVNTRLHYGPSDGEASTVRDQARTVWPQARTVRSVKNQKNLKVTSLVK
jgi:hypothetical protein